jgi:hypothetical protein
MSDTDIIEAEVVEDGHEMVVAQRATRTLLSTDDPIEVIEKATAIADKLKDVLRRQGLTSRIGNKDHVNVEGWQTVGAMVRVTPRKEWVRPIAWPAEEFLTDALRKQRDRGMTFGYEASYFAQTFDGVIVGAAEATCKRTESKWLGADDYAIESMAQTRATSKALGSVLRWIVTLSGYSGTPAEEMPTEQTPPEPPPAPKKIQREQAQQLGSIYADRTDDFLAALNELLGQSELTVAERVMAMTSDQAAQLIEQLGGKA